MALLLRLPEQPLRHVPPTPTNGFQVGARILEFLSAYLQVRPGYLGAYTFPDS
jgi:hypothetical protein